MPDGSPLDPALFLFTQEELALAPSIINTLVPPHLDASKCHFIPHSSASAVSKPSGATVVNPSEHVEMNTTTSSGVTVADAAAYTADGTNAPPPSTTTTAANVANVSNGKVSG